MSMRFLSLVVLGLAASALAPAQISDDGETTSKLVALMIDEKETFKNRVAAEVDLESRPTPEVLQAMLPHLGRRMPEGGIYNSGGRDFDAKAPPEWQVYYAIGRVWRHHTSGERRKAARPALPLLLAKFPNRRGPIIRAMHTCWGPEMEAPLAAIFRDEKKPAGDRLAAMRVLTFRSVTPYVQELLALTKGPGGGAWLDLMLEYRVRVKTGALDDVTQAGFERLVAMRRAQPSTASAGYFMARKLGDYVGEDFTPPRPAGVLKLPDSWFGETVTRALTWWSEREKKKTK